MRLIPSTGPSVPPRRTTWFVIGLLLCTAPGAAPALAGEPAKPAKGKGAFFWIEGEDATTKKVKPHPWWYDMVKHDQLSGGKWLHHFDEKVDGFAGYDLTVTRPGAYHFWLHANPVAAKLSYKVDGGDWTLIENIEKKSRDIVNIAADNKPDLRFVAWVEVGTLDLAKGNHTLEFKFHSDAQHHGGLDVIVLSMAPFTPRGVDRPGQDTGPAADAGNTWAFDAPKDPFREDAVLDLRRLNEKEAGEKGFVRLSEDGTGFVLGDGTPVRFWAVGDTVYTKSPEELAYHARFLAKSGVNMVRMHGSFSPKGPGKKLTDVDAEEIDRAWRCVAAMKKEGIYTIISPFWANGGHAGTAQSWGIGGYGDKEDIWALLFFRDDLKEGYKAWMKALLTRPNPYTGIPLAKDPGLAIIQTQNEDGLFFWTLQAVKPAQLELLGKTFGRWLVKKYGSLDAARTAWDDHGEAGDKFAAGTVGIMQTWHMTQAQTGGAAKRMRDQVRFLAELQREFYAEMARYFKDDLGCKQLVNASNWVTADPEKLNDLERWTYTAADVLAVNKYYGGGPHTGKNNGWRIDPGDFFEGRSALKNPTALPTDLKQVVGHPIMITESCWTFPLAWESEAPFLVAAYSGLTGVGPYFWFSADTPGYCTDPYFQFETLAGNQKGVFKWSLHPATQTQFPAAALLYRRGDVTRSQPVVHEERALDDLWDRKKPMLAEGRTFDPNRNTKFAEGADGTSAVDPLAFLVGRVEVKYGGNPAKSTAVDLSKYIHPAKKTVDSVTGELSFDYGAGVCTLDTPRAQGATGFLAEAGGTVKTADAVIRSGNRYATVTLVSLDDKPLKESAKVLVQVGTVARPTGWQTRPTTTEIDGTRYRGETVVNTGSMPWRFVDTDVTVSLANEGLTKAVLLDVNGYRAKDIPVKHGDGRLTLTLPTNCVYAVLEK